MIVVEASRNAALAVCGGPVRSACLAAALVEELSTLVAPSGIRGGIGPGDCLALLRAIRRGSSMPSGLDHVTG